VKKPHWFKRVLIGLALFTVVMLTVLLLLREVFFTGAILPPSPIPSGKIVDMHMHMHMHIAGIGAGGSGCYVSPVLQENFRFAQYLAGFGVTRRELQQHGDAVAVDKIAARLRSSSAV
jgi:hypothetical protein